MAKKPFKVSARTARLIGRENVANADGALIELVKNSYDADSKICILFMDIRYDCIPYYLSPTVYRKYYKETLSEINSSFMELAYEKDTSKSEYKLKINLEEELLRELEFFFKSKNSIYIIDSGEGMTEDVIDKHWMTIGTDNKLTDFVTANGRIKAGAKGIGRFALDRLGSLCHMVTLSDEENYNRGYHWKVDWEDFDEEGKSISQIEADFEFVDNFNYKREVLKFIPDIRISALINRNENLFENGTILKISELRDWWSIQEIEKLFRNLEVLSPPGNVEKFDIFLYTKKNVNSYGKINNEDFEDYDYRVDAIFKEDKTVEITIKRKEFQVNLFDSDLFKREQMKLFPYDNATFKNGEFRIQTTIFDLLPQLKGSNQESAAERLGAFDFSFYFLKMLSSRKEKEKFKYNPFSSSYRKEWYSKFGGIRVFRDNFRVRPYGENKSSSFDWLLLGERKAQSPAGVTKKGGGYKVSPNQVAGTVSISRLANLEFKDKSSREGFQENETFEVLKDLLKAVISQFEWDRHTVMREMDLFFRQKNEEEEAKAEADEIVENDNDDNKDDEREHEEIKHQRDILKKAYTSIKLDYEDTQEEVKILRALATTGLLVTSFAHEFETLRNQMHRRTGYLKSTLKKLLNEDDLNERLPSKSNPFKRLENFKKYDFRLKHWLDFSLAAIRKDKRNVQSINILEFLDGFKNDWEEVLNTRSVSLNITTRNTDSLRLNVFLIDIESVFNNLLINSFDAFDKNGFNGERKVNIEVDLYFDEDDNTEYFVIKYSDSGPGLKSNIKNPYDILKAGFTTKLNKNKEPVGTGIGMWIVDSVVEYYNGIIEIEKPNIGFAMSIKLPYKI